MRKGKNSTEQKLTKPSHIKLMGTESGSIPLEQWQVSLKDLSTKDRQKLKEDILNSAKKV
jgi:hypothetical protein